MVLHHIVTMALLGVSFHWGFLRVRFCTRRAQGQIPAGPSWPACPPSILLLHTLTPSRKHVSAAPERCVTSKRQIGAVILLLHDMCDIWMEAAKLAKYARAEMCASGPARRRR